MIEVYYHIINKKTGGEMKCILKSYIQSFTYLATYFNVVK